MSVACIVLLFVEKTLFVGFYVLVKQEFVKIVFEIEMEVAETMSNCEFA